MEASPQGYSKIIELLLARPEIKVNTKNKDGYTAFIRASFWGHTEIVELFLVDPRLDLSLHDQ